MYIYIYTYIHTYIALYSPSKALLVSALALHDSEGVGVSQLHPLNIEAGAWTGGWNHIQMLCDTNRRAYKALYSPWRALYAQQLILDMFFFLNTSGLTITDLLLTLHVLMGTGKCRRNKAIILSHFQVVTPPSQKAITKQLNMLTINKATRTL